MRGRCVAPYRVTHKCRVSVCGIGTRHPSNCGGPTPVFAANPSRIGRGRISCRRRNGHQSHRAPLVRKGRDWRSSSFKRHTCWFAGLLVEAAFQRRFGQSPVVSEMTFSSTVPSTRIRALSRQLKNAGTPSLEYSLFPETELPRHRVPRNIITAPQDIDEHFPSIWLGETYRVLATSEMPEVRAYDNYFLYESAFSSDPQSFPNDWGMEIGITIYNPSLSPLPRPLCGLDGGDSDWDFWSGTYQMGGLWGTNAPDNSHPYADYNIASDGCQENSVEIGIGSPTALEQDVTYIAFAELFPGNAGFSLMSASVSMKSNDCNDLLLDPGTNCMGLNTDRDPPTGFDGSATLVNAGRDWTVPGCFLMADGLEDPLRLSPGEGDCPIVVG